MTQEYFVTYDQAVKLKELGFDWECYTFYHSDNWCGLSRSGMYENHNMFEKCISAPTLAQSQKWLRDVKGIVIYSEPRFYKGKKPLLGYNYHLFDKDSGYHSHIESETVYDTYEQALSAGIDEALKLLN